MLKKYLMHDTFCPTPKNCLNKFNALAGAFLMQNELDSFWSQQVQKTHSVIVEILKNYLMHDVSCPAPKKMLEKIQNAKL